MIPERHDGMTIESDSDVERVARAMFRVGKEGWPPDELEDSCDRNWREMEEEARAAIAAMPGGEINHAYRLSAAYQIVGALLEMLGVFDSERGQTILSYLNGEDVPDPLPVSPNDFGISSPSREDVLIGALVKFAENAFRVSWDGCDLDGFEIQDKGVALGLLTKSEYDPSIHGDDFEGEPGDTYYTYSDAFKALLESLQSNPRPAPDVREDVSDEELRGEAVRRVREVRGSDDVPGFEACVEAELAAMRAARKAGG